MAQAAAEEVQALLRFLTQDAKVPLASALPTIGRLRKARLNNAESISKAPLGDIIAVFPDEKLAKQIGNAAKRVSKKRPADDLSQNRPSKRANVSRVPGSAIVEAELELPTTAMEEDELSSVVIQTNRAPLVLAFAIVLLKYTMPEQPLSSRLSLAQAVVSANSQSKAKSIGITKENTAEEEGWATGQPKVKVMSREIAVMRRAPPQVEDDVDEDSQATVKQEQSSTEEQTAFWGLDLEALRKSNGPLVAGKNVGGQPGLPIHTPQAARGYLLRSVAIAPTQESSQVKAEGSLSKKKPTAKELNVRKEEAAAMLLKAVDLLYKSWSGTLSATELDKRAWSWYLHVRPDVQQGQAGWGQKGLVRLGDILKLRRTS